MREIPPSARLSETFQHARELLDVFDEAVRAEETSRWRDRASSEIDVLIRFNADAQRRLALALTQDQRDSIESARAKIVQFEESLRERVGEIGTSFLRPPPLATPVDMDLPAIIPLPGVPAETASAPSITNPIPIELAANVWPVVDQSTRLVTRFFIRAYALESNDVLINQTLRALAPTDYCMARMFEMPGRFVLVNEHGSLPGCVPLADFYPKSVQILDEAMKAVEQDYARLQGSVTSGEMMQAVNILPRFARDPFVVITPLLETPDGMLLPQVKPRAPAASV